MSQRTSSKNFLLLVLVAAAVAVGFAWLLRRAAVEPNIGGLAPGNPAPEIAAAGWLNGEPPSAEERRGRVTVVYAWRTDCLPCWREAPHLVELHERFGEQGVAFVGLTMEGPEVLSEIQEYIERNGIVFPIGYGAVDTLVALDAQVVPTAWVIDRDGRIVWNSSSGGNLANAIERALRAGGSSPASRQAARLSSPRVLTRAAGESPAASD